MTDGILGDTEVVVTRGWGDHRRLTVRADDLSGFRIVTNQGGHGAPLPRPVLAAYMSCDVIPDGAEFGHTCEHGPPPHRIKVLILKSHNTPATYRALRAGAS